MTKIAYLECPTGIAGDMCLGALIHAGLPLEYLETQLRRLGVSHEYVLRVETVQRNGQSATKLYVDLKALADPKAVANREPGVDVHSTFQHAYSQQKNVILSEQNAVESHSESHSELHSERHSNFHPHAPHGYTHESDHSHPHENHSHLHAHSHSHSAAQSLSHPASDNTNSKKLSYDSHDHDLSHHAGTRHLGDIEQLILAAGLPSRAEAWSLAVFRQLAIAEGAVHGIPIEAVHFHEVGATDAIVDIVGTCLGLDWLGIEQLYCSAMPTGGGTIWAAHGRLPVPTPAVLKLWEMRQVPIYSNGIERELVTPTGAAIATTLAASFGPPPPMTLTRVGLGAGGRDLPIPNILRLWIGEAPGEPSGQKMGSLASQQAIAPTPAPAAHAAPALASPSPIAQGDLSAQVAVLETQIDDASPQAIAYTLEALLAAGALDVFTQPVTMKKSRLGTLITVICPVDLAEACKAILFRETTTLGIRESVQQRTILDREFQTVETEFGQVAMKLGKHPVTGELLNMQPEYEDCAKLARDHQVSWMTVHQAARRVWDTHAALQSQKSG
jgi:uncharacterized protein (TIGR00299 family) protein